MQGTAEANKAEAKQKQSRSKAEAKQKQSKSKATAKQNTHPLSTCSKTTGPESLEGFQQHAHSRS